MKGETMTSKKRGQPKKEIRRTHLKLTVLPKTKALAGKLAFAGNKSISRLFEDMVLREIEAQKSAKA